MAREKTKYPGIYKRGKNYSITYYVGDVKKEKAVGPRLDDAIKEKIECERKAKRGKRKALIEQEKMTFADLFKLYEEKGDKKDYILRPKQTYIDYFGKMKLSQITRRDLFEFRDKIKETPKERGKSEVTNAHCNRILAGLRRLFSFAENQEVIEVSPFPKSPKSGLFAPEPKGRRHFFTQEEVVSILGASEDWLNPIVLTAYYTGMRLGEILKLQWEHVNFALGAINLPNSKTMKDSTGMGQVIAMHPELKAVLQKLHERRSGSLADEWVFTNANGLPYRHWHVYKPFKKILVKLGIKGFSFKEMRHTTGSIMNIKGVGLMSIKDQLRHTDAKTTQNYYIGIDLEHQRKEIEKITLPEAEA